MVSVDLYVEEWLEMKEQSAFSNQRSALSRQLSAISRQLLHNVLIADC
jgi:hypothetical protein